MRGEEGIDGRDLAAYRETRRKERHVVRARNRELRLHNPIARRGGGQGAPYSIFKGVRRPLLRPLKRERRREDLNTCVCVSTHALTIPRPRVLARYLLAPLRLVTDRI